MRYEASRFRKGTRGLRMSEMSRRDFLDGFALAIARVPVHDAAGRLEPEERYDLVVVGGGISGLAAAYFYRRAKPQARILVLDNHDDFGGHAKRNEFTVDGRLLMGYGGSQS